VAKVNDARIYMLKNCGAVAPSTWHFFYNYCMARYKTKYIQPLADTLKAFCGRVPGPVLIIEPDSLPNLATNKADPHCGNTATTASCTQADK
jgi:hypothetical protein